MTDQQFQQLLLILGQIGNQAYQAAYHQALLVGNVDLVVGIACSLTWLLALVCVVQMIRRYWDKSDVGEGQVILVFVSGIWSVVGAIVQIVVYGDAVLNLGNPQWQAIQYLARLVKGG